LSKRTSARSRSFFDNRGALLLTITAIAVTARVVFLSLFEGSFLANGIWSDAATYDQWAKRIVASNNWVGSEAFFMTPLYPYFLAAVYSIFGYSVFLVRVIQSAAGVGVVILVFLIAEHLFSSRKAGLAAALLASVYGPFLLSQNLLLVETLRTFLLVSAFYLVLHTKEKRKPLWWSAAGILFGLAALGRPSDLLTAGAVIIWTFFFSKASSKEKALHTGALVAGLLLVILPVTLRNYVVSGEFIPITSNGGLNFYLGNNPEAVGVYYNVDTLDLANDPDGRLFLEQRLGRSLKHSEASAYWLERAGDFILSQPLSFIELIGKKAMLFFHHQEISQLGYNYAFVARYAVPVLDAFPSFLVAGSLGAVGFALGMRQWRRLSLLYAVLGAQILGVVLFFVADRFRLSALPFLIIFAGYAIVESVASIRRGNKRLIAVALTVVIIAVLISTVLNFEIAQEFSLEWEYVGLTRFESREYSGALAAFQESVREKDSFHIRNNIGNAYLSLGNGDLALEQYRAAQVMNPRQPASSFGIGNVFAGKRQWEDALRSFDDALAINPRFAPAHLNKGLTYYYMQRFPDALESLRRYVALEKDTNKLGSVLQDIHNLEQLVPLPKR